MNDKSRSEESNNASRKVGVNQGNYNENIGGDYNQGDSHKHYYAAPEPKEINPNTPSNLNQAGSANFVGREEQLEELHQLLQQNEQVSISAIAGMGGIGKTELALQYALTYQDEYPGSLCWFSVRGENLVTQIIEFARSRLKVFPPDELNSDQAKLDYCWQNWRSETSLIVLDDVPNYGKFYREKIKPYLPPRTNKIKVLMTSRERPGANIPRIDLDVLSKANALELLESFIGKTRIEAELEQAQELCKWLGYLPLGLELVGRYIDLDGNLTIEKTLKRLERKKLEAIALLDPEQADMNAQLGVASAFDLSWGILSPEAQELGCYLSLFDSEPFKWTWVETAWIISEDEEEREDGTEDLEHLRNVQLTQRNLLKAVPENQAYQLHSLIAQYFRAKLEKGEQATELKQKFCKVVIEISQSIPHTPTIQEIEAVTIAIPHLINVAQELTEYIDNENLFWSYVGLGSFYRGQGLYNQAEQWLEQCLNSCRERLGEKHPHVATSLNNLAALYDNQGRYESAEPLYLQALELRKQLLGEQHPDVATSLNNLAALYDTQGRYESAEPLYLQALELRKQLLGEQHPHVATSLNNLAGLYESQGRYESAEPLYLQALELRKQLLGEQHPHVATSLNNLALLYDAQGRYESAEPLYLQALEQRKQLLGEKHPHVATSLNNLAALYRAQGRYESAEPLYIQALEQRKQLLGEKHPHVATSLNNLAELYDAQGRYKSAEPLYLQALELRKQLLGEQHPDVATSLNNLALLYYAQGRYESAEPLYRQALEQRKQLLGEQHPDVATSLNNLALLYYAQGRYESAEPLYRQALEQRKQLLGEQHPDVAQSLNNLAALYYAQGRYESAELLYLQALEQRKQLLGEQHPHVATSLNNLAALYYAQGKYKSAEPLYLQALEIAKSVLGENHPSTKTIQDNFTYCYDDEISPDA